MQFTGVTIERSLGLKVSVKDTSACGTFADEYLVEIDDFSSNVHNTGSTASECNIDLCFGGEDFSFYVRIGTIHVLTETDTGTQWYIFLVLYTLW